MVEFVPLEQPHPPGIVTDDKSARYPLGDLLGQGGQGAVYRTTDGRAAVKLVYASNPDHRLALQSRVERLQSRPLWDLPISRPIAVLERAEWLGYVMELCVGTVPISQLAGLGREFPDVGSLAQWYNNETGGLRRRLILLARAAETLAWLHGIPLVYADPSPSNILVPLELDDFDVWLIDPDNIGLGQPEAAELDDGADADADDIGYSPADADDLQFDGPFDDHDLQFDRASDAQDQEVGTPAAQTIVTRPYAAPEMNTGRVVGPSAFTDAFSFAVVAYEVMTLQHPFLGDRFDDLPPETALEAYAGQWPWIDDADDENNRRENHWLKRRGPVPGPEGRPGLMLNAALQKLAQQTFGQGRANPAARPPVSAWADALRRAADRTLPCECGATFYPFYDAVEPGAHCTWCGRRRSAFADLVLLTWVPPMERGGVSWDGGVPTDQPVSGAVVIPPSGRVLTRRMAYAGSLLDPHAPVIKAWWTSEGVTVLRSDPNAEVWIEEPGSGSTWAPLTEAVTLRWARLGELSSPARGWVHFGSPTEFHRVAQIEEFSAP